MKNQQLKAMMAQKIADSEKNTAEVEVKVLNSEELKLTVGGTCNANSCNINTVVGCPAN